MRWVVLIGMVLAALIPASAQAHTKTCVRYLAYYSDNGSGSSGANGSGDYWTTNASRALPGVQILAYEIQTQSWLPAVYADYDGTDIGCATIPTTAGRTYAMYAVSKSKILFDNIVEVLNPNTVSGGDYRNDGDPYVTNLGLQSHNAHITRTLSAIRYNLIQGAAVWALQRRNAGFGSTRFRMFNRGCPPPSSGSCYKAKEDAVFTDSSSKFVIIHELGHAIGAMRNASSSGPQSTNGDYTASASICTPVGTTSHSMDSKEFQSSAASEGFAHYYAAVSWNYSNQNDCRFGYYKSVDYNHDGTLDPQSQLNCEGSPALNTPSGGSAPPSVASGDYLGDQCVASWNRGTEYDWLRFWWDVDTNAGLNTTIIADIWDDADPYAWRATDSGSGPLPVDEIEQGFIDEGFASQWPFWSSYNGVDR